MVRYSKVSRAFLSTEKKFSYWTACISSDGGGIWRGFGMDSYGEFPSPKKSI